MKPAYLVRFSSPDPDTISRIRHFAEDVLRALHAAGLGDVPNEASATDEVKVHVSAARHLGRALQAINLQLRKHNLDQDAVVSRVKE